jgi:hypothetical protein
MAFLQLDLRYGGERRLLQRHVEAFIWLPATKEESLTELEDISNRLCDIIAKLNDYGLTRELVGNSSLRFVRTLLILVSGVCHCVSGCVCLCLSRLKLVSCKLWLCWFQDIFEMLPIMFDRKVYNCFRWSSGWLIMIFSIRSSWFKCKLNSSLAFIVVSILNTWNKIDRPMSFLQEENVLISIQTLGQWSCAGYML